MLTMAGPYISYVFPDISAVVPLFRDASQVFSIHVDFNGEIRFIVLFDDWLIG